jgi:serine/threonine-protein kinase
MGDMPVDALFLAFQEAVVGQFSLERELGRGGMGVVYLAREVRLDRHVAIKLLPPQLAAQPQLRERFLREARTAARLSHPYIVPIYSVDEVGDFVFYSMAYVDGETLAELVAARGAVPHADVTRVLRECAWALAYAHAQGVVHRDVKPANILLERGTGRAMVTDFGIARLTHTSGETGAGEVLGTPEYMSPEQAAGEPLDGRSDLYALGIVGYFALTGSVPFTGSAQSVLAQHLTKPAPAVATAARGAPRALSEAIDCCLAKDREQRFATGEALADALAPALVKRAEIPVALRSFIDWRANALLGFCAAAGTWGVSLAISDARTPFWAGAVLAGAGLGAAVGLGFARLRRLARLGYDASDIAAALRLACERRREEFLFDFGPTETPRERITRRIAYTAFGFGLTLLVVPMIPAVYRTLSLVMNVNQVFPPLIATGLFAGGIVGAGAWRWQFLRSGTDPCMARFWDKGLGRLLAKFVALGVRRRAIPAERATELAIAMSAESLFEALPKELRHRFGDVPKLLNDLQTRATAAREEIAALDASLSAARQAPARESTRERHDALTGDLRSARERAEGRLAQLVTALETVRLDLLRLQAGVGSPESITLDLDAAAALSKEAERMLAARRETEETIKR